MKKTEITCDNCGKDLQHTSYMSEYYLTLSPSPKSNMSGMCFAMAIPSEISEQKDFCKLSCLKEWLTK